MADIRLNVESKGLSFEQKKNGECKITGIGACTECDIIIGEKQKRLLGTLTVSEIGIGAFAKMTRIESVVIPASVKKIGAGAFSGCENLRRVTILGGVEEIGEGAFEGCSSLSSINIPYSVERIRARLFSGCSSLCSVHIPSYVTEIGDGAFEGCVSLQSINIPASVERIGEGAFFGCEGIASITVDNQNPVYRDKGNCLIKRSDGGIILGCKSSVIPYDIEVRYIGESAFIRCTGLSCVHIPESIEKIADTAFFNTEVRDVYYAGSEKEWKRIETPAVKHFFECAQIYFEKDE